MLSALRFELLDIMPLLLSINMSHSLIRTGFFVENFSFYVATLKFTFWTIILS